MAKVSPTTRTEMALDPSSGRMKDFLSTLRGEIEDDAAGRRDWLNDKRYWRRRRYGKEHRYTDYPWPGGSEIVMPTIDMTIDRMKAAYAAYLAHKSPPCTVLGATDQEVQQAPTIEFFFEWLVRKGSPRYLREMLLGLDDLFECGRMVMKSLWWYETRNAPETLSRRTLPQELRRYISVGSERNLAAATVLTGQEFQSDKTFRKRQKDIQQAVSVYLDLDPEEARDQAAIEKVMKWLYEGAEGEITYKKRDTLWDAPAVVAVDPEHLIVPAYATSIENAEHITHEMMLTETEIRSRAKDYRWNQAVVDKVLKMGPAGSTRPRGTWSQIFQESYDFDVAKQESNNLYRIYESCCWMDFDRDGRDEKVVALWFANFDEAPLKLIAYQRPSGKWPYHTCEFELNGRYWYEPRGVPEITSDIDFEITQQHRAKLNRMTIANAPVFMYRMHRGLNPENIRWIPGQMVPVNDPSDILPLQVPNLDMSYEREEQILKTWNEQRTGGVDFALNNPLSSLQEPRTRYEVQQVMSNSKTIMSLRGALWQQMLSEIYGEFFDLWQTYGPDDVYIRVTGEQPIQISKEDLQGDYLFQVEGAIGDEDPELRAQKALTRIQVLTPFLAQPQLLGTKFEIDGGELVAEYLESQDIRSARRILRRRSPEEVQQIEAEQKRAQQVQGMMQGIQQASLIAERNRPAAGTG